MLYPISIIFDICTRSIYISHYHHLRSSKVPQAITDQYRHTFLLCSQTDVRDYLSAIYFRSSFDLHTASIIDYASGLPIILDPEMPNVINREVI